MSKWFWSLQLEISFSPFSLKHLHFDRDVIHLWKIPLNIFPWMYSFHIYFKSKYLPGLPTVPFRCSHKSNYFKTFIRQVRTQEWLGAGCHMWDVSPGKCSNFYDIYHVNLISNHCHQCGHITTSTQALCLFLPCHSEGKKGESSWVQGWSCCLNCCCSCF